MLALDGFVASDCHACGHATCNVCQSCFNTIVLETLPQRHKLCFTGEKNMAVARSHTFTISANIRAPFIFFPHLIMLLKIIIAKVLRYQFIPDT